MTDNNRTSQDGALAIAAIEARLRAIEGNLTRRYRSKTAGLYTPTLTNVAIGTGGSAANTAAFSFDGVHLTVTGLLVLGTSGASVSGIPRLAWPAGFSELFALSNTHPLGECTLLGSVGCVARVTRGTVAGTVALTTVTWDGTKLIYASVSATAPFTWAAGHSMLYTYRIPGTFT